MGGRHSTGMGEQSRNEEFREGAKRAVFVTSCRVETGEVAWVGHQERQELSLVRGDGGCSSSWGSQHSTRRVHSRAGIAELRHWGLSALPGLPLEQTASSLREIIHCTLPCSSSSRLPLGCGQTQTLISACLSCWVPWDCSCRLQTPSQGIPGLACPAAVTAHLETIMNLLSSSGCSNHWIIFPSSCFHPYAAKCHLADPSVLKPCSPSPFHVFLNNFPLHKTLAVHSTLSGTKLDTFMSSRLKSACFPCLHQDTLFSRALVISAGKCPQNNVQSKHFWGLI